MLLTFGVWVILCDGDCPVHCRMLSSVSGGRNTPRCSCDNQRCLQTWPRCPLGCRHHAIRSLAIHLFLAISPRFVCLKIKTTMYTCFKMCKLHRIYKAKHSSMSLFLQRCPFPTIWGVYSRLFVCAHLLFFFFK